MAAKQLTENLKNDANTSSSKDSFGATKGVENEVSKLYCADIAEAMCILKELANEKGLAVDVESVDLNDMRTDVSLIQIGTPTQTVVFDILQMKHSPEFLSHLRPILKNQHIIKYFFDCRHACNILKKRYQIDVKNILDLQLLEVLYRVKYAQKGKELKKLHGILSADSIKREPHLYVNIFRLASLGNLACDYGMRVSVPPKYYEWNQRPLSDSQLMYAYERIAQIWSLLPILTLHFEEKGPIDYNSWKQASLRYADLFRHQSNDALLLSRYYQNPMLPLGILDEVSGNKHGRNSQYQMCVDCCRGFLLPINSEGNQCCDICRAIDRHVGIKHSQEANFAMDLVPQGTSDSVDVGHISFSDLDGRFFTTHDLL